MQQVFQDDQIINAEEINLFNMRIGFTADNIRQFSSSIIDNANVWLNVLDLKLNIVFWNHAAEVISGYSHEDVIGNNRIWEWMYPGMQYRQSVMARTAALLEKTGDIEYFETKVRCKNNEIKYILWNSRSLVNKDGAIFGVLTFGYDITDRKQAEEALQKANSEISALYHVASVTSASLDLDTILESSLECVLETMESDMGLIHLWDDHDEELHLAAYHGISSDLMMKMNRVSQGKGLTGWVFKYGKPLTTPNLQIGPANSPAICSDLDNAYLGVPMRARGKVVGVFSILAQSKREFGSDEVALLGSIADQVGIAVENARLYQQAEQLAVLEERHRLAQDLHDSVTQSLYSLTLLAEASRRLVKSGNLEQAEDYLTRLGETALDSLKEMRLLVYNLRTPALDDGLVVALQQRLAAVERRAGVKAHLIAGDISKLPGSIEESLYRIAQEALNNAIKHAKADSVIIRILPENNSIKLEVEDDGVGFDQTAVDYRHGMGLTIMNERVKSIGGSLNISSSPNNGTRISVLVKAE